MTYKKDSDLKYWELAKYIDDHIREEDCDENKCFEYMYHLFYILAVKGRFFQVASDYDSYAIYGATQLFLRYRKEKDKNLKRTLKPIKSSLNYIKKILYPLRVNYQKETFGQVFQEESTSDSATHLFEDKSSEVRRLNNNLLEVEYSHCISQIASTVRLIINSTPYSKDPVMVHNLYISCLLTLIRSMTMSRKNKIRLLNRERRHLSIEGLVEQIYAEESTDSAVAYHLDDTMLNYISTLVNRIKKEVAKDLRYIVGSYELPDSIIKSILVSPIGDLVDEF